MRNVVFALAVFALGLGCSSGSSDSATVTADQACTDFAATLCDQIQTCAATYVQSSYGDVANCKTRAKLECMQTASAPNTGATAPDIAACASAAKSTPCSALLNNQWPSQCTPKSGGVADGAPCGNDSQCKSGFCGLDDDKEVCGVCAKRPGEGEACVRGRCPLGLICSDNNTLCVKPVAVGGACDGKTACTAASHCYASKCVADVATEGGACDSDSVAGPACDGTKGLICLGKKCIKVSFTTAGAECGIKFEGTTIKSFALCEKSGWCKGFNATATPPTFTGTCEPAAADGQPCIADATFEKGPGCLEPAECVGGKCTLPDATVCK